MILVLKVVHVMVSIVLVSVVLLQRNSGGDMGAAFGGSSQSVFGSQGSGGFLGKLTAVLATLFMVTSLSLAFVSTRSSGPASVMDGVATTAPAQSAPAPDEAPVPAKGAAPVAGETAPPAGGSKPVPVP